MVYPIDLAVVDNVFPVRIGVTIRDASDVESANFCTGRYCTISSYHSDGGHCPRVSLPISNEQKIWDLGFPGVQVSGSSGNRLLPLGGCVLVLKRSLNSDGRDLSSMHVLRTVDHYDGPRHQHWGIIRGFTILSKPSINADYLCYSIHALCQPLKGQYLACSA